MHSEQEKSDEALVELALSQKEFFGLLVERYEIPLARYVRRLGASDDEDILDILQEVFIKTYRNLNDFDTSLRFSSWVYRIAHNETVSWFRKRNVRPEGHLVENGDEVLNFIQNGEWSNEEEFDKNLNKEKLSLILKLLEEKYREVIILRFFEHKEYDEISDILKIPIGSVGTLLHRAKKQIRTLINREAINI